MKWNEINENEISFIKFFNLKTLKNIYLNKFDILKKVFFYNYHVINITSFNQYSIP